MTSMAIDRDRAKERAVRRMTPPANTSKEGRRATQGCAPHSLV